MAARAEALDVMKLRHSWIRYRSIVPASPARLAAAFRSATYCTITEPLGERLAIVELGRAPAPSGYRPVILADLGLLFLIVHLLDLEI